MPRVSVIIPAYDSQETLPRAISSALDQTVGDTEVIVVDDGTVPALALAPEMEKAGVRLLRHESNRGAAAARNTGAEAAAGEWLAFLDSDDAWHPGKLEAQLAAAGRIRAGGLAAIATGWRYVVDGQAGGGLIPIEASDLHRFAAGCWFCPGSTLLLRREAFFEVGPQDEALPRLEDYDWFLRFAALGGVLHVAGSCLVDVHRTAPPDLAAVRRAAATMRARYCRAGGAGFIPSRAVRRRVRAYLALTEAAAAMSGRAPMAGVFALARSFALLPRQRVQLEQFWNPVP